MCPLEHRQNKTFKKFMLFGTQIKTDSPAEMAAKTWLDACLFKKSKYLQISCSLCGGDGVEEERECGARLGGNGKKREVEG